MVDAMRHWASVTAVITRKGKRLSLTPFGAFLFGEKGADPYLEDEATLWLLHWRIASAAEQFTAGYWFFNRFFSADFLSGEAEGVISEQVRARGLPVSRGMVERDLRVLLRMYAPRKAVAEDDCLDTPFPELGLIAYEEATQEYRSEMEERETLPSAVIGFAAVQLMRQTGLQSLAVRGSLAPPNCPSLEYSFRLTEESLLHKLEEFCSQVPDMELRQPAGIWQLLLTGALPSEKQALSVVYPSSGK